MQLRAARAMTVATSVLVFLIGNRLIEVKINTIGIPDSLNVLDHEELYNHAVFILM